MPPFCRKSASCTHVSALLHILVSFTPPGFEHALNNDTGAEDAVQPVTSFLCQWDAPHKHKESNMQISNTKFQKHVYGRKRKHAIEPLTDFDPRPEELRGNSKEQLTTYLNKVRGQGIGLSLLFDDQSRCWSTASESTSQNYHTPMLPTKRELQERVTAFRICLSKNYAKLNSQLEIKVKAHCGMLSEGIELQHHILEKFFIANPQHLQKLLCFK